MMKKLLVASFFVFIMCSVHAEYFLQNIDNGCTSSVLNDFLGNAYLIPQFTVNTYTCSSGYYLPANALECQACPLLGYDCPGGTYEYNPNQDQGISYKRPISENVINGCVGDLLISENNDVNLSPIFIINQYTCSAGQYLPANVDECTQCPANSACVGGTYSFNETISQGIEPCATGYSSVAGASVCTANTINITWDSADANDIATNNADTVTYGADIRTPKKAQHINGKIFVGWTFNNPE